MHADVDAHMNNRDNAPSVWWDSYMKITYVALALTIIPAFFTIIFFGP